MKKFLIHCLTYMALSIAALASPVVAEEWSIGAMNATIDQTNFMVNDGCSGTLIYLTKRYILTASHCVTDQYETVTREAVDDKGVVHSEKVRRLKQGSVRQLYFVGGSEVRTVTYTTKLIAVDVVKDLALLQIITPSIPNTMQATLACTAPVRGERVYIVGNPMATLYSSVVSGIVSSNQRDYRRLNFGDEAQIDEPLMQVSGGVIAGNSGGAAYNVKGELVGVPIIGSRVNETIGFAVPLDVIREFLTDNKVDMVACK